MLSIDAAFFLLFFLDLFEVRVASLIRLLQRLVEDLDFVAVQDFDVALLERRQFERDGRRVKIGPLAEFEGAEALAQAGACERRSLC